jgi:peptidoglycan/LPS O-acetylase OafA/YrhL
MSRIKPLDALRGIAAFIVLLAQCYAIWPEAARDQLRWLNHTPLRLLINGHAAVTLFFVLSGFVLALPFLAGKGGSYAHFVMRRLCRIYLPFVTAIALALLLYGISGGQPSADGSLWFNEKWLDGFAVADVLRHLLMTGRMQDMGLNHNMWTLVHELRIALIFPFLMAFCADTRRVVIGTVILFVACSLAMVALAPATDEFFIDTRSLAITFLITGRNAAFFIVGILLARHKDMLKLRLTSLGRWAHCGLWALCLVILIAPHFPEEDVFQAVAAALAIMLVQVQPRLGAWLASGVTAWLGRMSYSLYLVHLPILFALFHLYLGKLPFGMIVGMGVIVSLSAAEIMYRLVESPAIALGRRLTAEPAKPSPLAQDVHGRVVAVGARVRLLKLSGKWLDDLTADEKQEVLSMVGEVFEVEDVNEYGHAEICKWWQDESDEKSSRSHSHTICLEPHEMELIQDML